MLPVLTMPPERSHSNTPKGFQRPPEAANSIKLISKIPHILPHERVFPIQIGSELFKLSGASISSDAPSYFSQYFQCQIKAAEENGQDISTAIRTLYIDRDPVTFRDISLHLQGYHVTPSDGTHFVRLFADAQFYSLPKLVSQLYEESIFMSIGHREFQIPRDLFSDPGNNPNYFSLGFAVFFSSPEDLFPGLDREGLIRPPSILPPSVPQRSAETFAELLHLLRGYPVNIRDEAHRASLLRDCRYFNFKGVEQKLIPHAITYNQARKKDEIALRLEDILKSGISILPDPLPEAGQPGADLMAGWVNYARPYVDDKAAELVLEIGGEMTKLHLTGGPRVEFFRDARTRVAKLFEVVATKLNLPSTTQPLGLLMATGGASSRPPTLGSTPLSDDDLVQVEIVNETSITLDGRAYVGHVGFPPPYEQGGGGGGEDAMDFGGEHNSFPNPSSAGPADSSASLAELSLNHPRKRRRVEMPGFAGGLGAGGLEGTWVVRTGQWRLRIQSARNGKGGVECVLVAVKLDAMSSEHSRNEARGFLKG